MRKSTALFSSSSLFPLCRSFVILPFLSSTWTIIAKLIRKSNWKSLRKGKKILALGEYKRITDNNGKFVFFRCCYVCYKKKFDWAALIFLTRCVCHLQSFWKVLKVDSNETETPQAPHNITSAKLKSCFKRREFFSCFFPLNGFSRQLRLIPWKEKKCLSERNWGTRNEMSKKQGKISWWWRKVFSFNFYGITSLIIIAIIIARGTNLSSSCLRVVREASKKFLSPCSPFYED